MTIVENIRRRMSTVSFGRRQSTTPADDTQHSQPSLVQAIVRRLSTVSINSLKRRPSRAVPTNQSSESSIVEQLRKELTKFDEAMAESEKIDLRDVDFMINHDQMLQRIVTEYYDESQTISKMLKIVMDCLRARKTISMSDINACDFPSDMYDMNMMAIHELPTDHEIHIFMRGRLYRKMSPFDLLYPRFLVLQLEILLKKTGDRCHTWVFDASGCSLSTFEAFFYFGLSLDHLYPGYLEKLYIVDLPFLLRLPIKALVKIAPARLSNKLVVCSASEAIDKIGINQCPSFIGGKGDAVKGMVWTVDNKPPVCATYEQTADQYKATSSNIQKLESVLKSSIKENPIKRG